MTNTFYFIPKEFLSDCTSNHCNILRGILRQHASLMAGVRHWSELTSMVSKTQGVLNIEEHTKKYSASTEEFSSKVGRTQRMRHRKVRREYRAEQSELRRVQSINTRFHTPRISHFYCWPENQNFTEAELKPLLLEKTIHFTTECSVTIFLNKNFEF